jgi:hypothetical protein
MTTQLSRSLATLSFGFIGWMCIASQAHAQYPPPAPAGSNSNQPMIIHIHHHHYSPASAFVNQPPTRAQSLPYLYGNQNVTGAYVQPWKQNWDHLGFTGYLGQHGGGVDPTLDVVSGLVVSTVTPDSPAAKMGLVVGDFITKINGTAATNYRQVAVLFEETRDNPKHEIELTVWNPNTRRTNTIKAILEGLVPKKKPDPEEYSPEE